MSDDFMSPGLKLFIVVGGAGASCLLLGPPGFIHHSGYPELIVCP